MMLYYNSKGAHTMQFFRFLKWQWSKWIFWQKMFIASITVQLSSAFMPEPYDNIFRFTGIFVVFAFAFKWFVWDNAVKSWNDYKQERHGIFNTIKESDK